MLPLLSSPLVYVFFLHSGQLWHRASIALAPSFGVGTPRLERLSLRAGSNARQPFLDASWAPGATWDCASPCVWGHLLGCRLRMREIVRREGSDATWCRRRWSRITWALTLRDSPGDTLSRKRTIALSSASGVWVGVILGRRERSWNQLGLLAS